MKKQTTIKTAGILAAIGLTAVFSGCSGGKTSPIVYDIVYDIAPVREASAKEKKSFSKLEKTSADRCIENRLTKVYSSLMDPSDVDYMEVSDEHLTSAKDYCKEEQKNELKLNRYNGTPRLAVTWHVTIGLNRYFD